MFALFTITSYTIIFNSVKEYLSKLQIMARPRKIRPQIDSRGMRLEVPIPIHRRLRRIYDERSYAGLDETLADLTVVLMDMGLDALEKKGITSPQKSIVELLQNKYENEVGDLKSV